MALSVACRESRHCAVYSDKPTGWTMRGSSSGSGGRFFLSPKRPYQLWDPRSLLFNEYQCYIRWEGQIGRGVTLTTHLPLASRLRMSGAITLLPPICPHGVDRDNCIHTFVPLCVPYNVERSGGCSPGGRQIFSTGTARPGVPSLLL
jgi:hypothetical protein